MPNTFGDSNTSARSTAPTRWPAREPEPGEFFDPEPGSWLGPNPQIRSVGRGRVEAGRLGPRRFRLLRHVGYRDRATGQTWVFPRDLESWSLDFGSMPTLLNWIIPVRGSHFNAFVIHDGLVEDAIFDPNTLTPQLGTDYVGPKVSREEADRIARDAMHEFGTGFVRRWIGWAGMLIGTVRSAESLGASQRRGRYEGAFWSLIVLLLALGAFSTGEIFGWWNVLPWMTGEVWYVRLLWGGLAAIATPLALSVVWAALFGRWRFWVIVGVLLAVLLLPILLTGAVSVLAVLAERMFKQLGLTRDNETELPADVFDGERPAPEVGR